MRRAETRSDPFFTSTKYYLRSSVMGGLVVAEINAGGKRELGYVYANGMEIGRYRKPSSSQGFEVQWSHAEPMTGDRIEGGMSITTDPLGGLVPGSDPFVTPNVEYGDLLEGRESHTADSDPFSLGSGCSLDGVPIDCNVVISLLSNGAAVVKVTSGVNEITLPARVTSGVNENIVSASAIGIGGSWVWSTTDAEATDYDSGSGGGVRLGVSVKNWAWRWVPFGGGVGFIGVGFQQQDLKEIWRQHKEDEARAGRKYPEPQKPLPCDYESSLPAFVQIAKRLGGFYYESKPGEPDSIAMIGGVKMSQQQVANSFNLIFPDPFHPGGTDVATFVDGRWYHLTIGYGYRTEKALRRWLEDVVEVDVKVKDNTQPPSWITIHCEPNEPGTLRHFLFDVLFPKFR